MATVKFLHHVTLNGVAYIPGDVVSFDNKTAARLVFASRAIYTVEPPGPVPDPVFAETIRDTVAAFLVAGSNVTLIHDDLADTLTIAATGSGGGGGSTDPELVRDIIGSALAGANGVGVTVNDPGDTITVAITGVTIAQVSGLQTALDARAPLSHSHTASQVVDFAEAAQDAIAGFLVAGAGVTLTHNDASNTLTIAATGGGAGTTDPEVVRDTIAAALQGADGVTVTVDDAGNTITVSVSNIAIDRVSGLQTALDGKAAASHTHTASQVTDLTEAAQDAIAGFLVAGAGVTLTHNDASNTLTIASTGGGAGVTDPEVVRDTIAAAISGTNGVTVTHNDAANTIVVSISGITISQVTDLQATLTSLESSLAGKAAASHGHVASQVSDFTESVQDAVAAMLISGSNVSLTYNDSAGTLTVGVTGGGVESVNGQTGAVTLTAESVGADPAGTAATAVAELVSSAPETLDTLNELAAALGNDADHAATVTAALAGKAPIGHTHVPADLPISVMLVVTYAGGTPVRPDLVENGRKCFWICTTPAIPPKVTSGTAGRAENDIVGVVG